VQGRFAAAEIRVVHARKVVNNQGTGVNELNRARRFENALIERAEDLGGQYCQTRPQSLATGEERVLKRLI
jgi:hypothetical protein